MQMIYFLLAVFLIQSAIFQGNDTKHHSQVRIEIPDSSSDKLYVWNLRYFSSKAETMDTTLQRNPDGIFQYSFQHTKPKLIRILPDTGFAKGTRMLINPKKYYYYNMCPNFYNKGLDLFQEPGESLEIRVPDAGDFRYSARFSGNGASKQKYFHHFRDEFTRLHITKKSG